MMFGEYQIVVIVVLWIILTIAMIFEEHGKLMDEQWDYYSTLYQERFVEFSRTFPVVGRSEEDKTAIMAIHYSQSMFIEGVFGIPRF